MDASGEAEFEAFVRASSESLLRTAWLLTGDRGHAEDVVQTALERVALRWHRCRDNPEGYARRVVVNLTIDRSRRLSARAREVPLTPELDGSVADDLDGVVQRQTLVDALQTLSHRQRSVLVLRYFLDLDEAETAAVLKVSRGTVKSSASRGLARLRGAPSALGLDTEEAAP